VKFPPCVLRLTRLNSTCSTPADSPPEALRIRLEVRTPLKHRAAYGVGWKSTITTEVGTPVLHTAELSELIGCIYDAASDQRLWPVFLERLGRMTHSLATTMMMHNARRAEYFASSSWGFDARDMQLYQDRYGALDVWASEAYSKPTGHVCASETLCSLAALERSEFYNDLMRRLSVKHAMFGLVANQAGALATVSLFRDPHAGEFLEPQLKILELLVPHVQRAFSIHFNLAGSNSRADGFERALDMLTFGVIFVDSSQSVVFMNTRATAYIRSASGLRIRAGKLLLGKISDSERLRSLLDGAIKTARGDGVRPGGTMMAARSSAPPLCLTVAPLRSTEPLGHSTAVIFISDPQDRTELPGDLLRRSYGLTRAECRLVLLLVEGNSLAESAKLLCVTLNTVKTQLKSVFAKTKVNRQADLLRLLFRNSFARSTF
jgi:DNA-binding CsgD family transcriptional regulator